MSARANTTSHSEWSASPDKSFIATKAFPLEFYQYAASRATDLSMQGELVLHAHATANRCPAGRVLHANGKKLIPGVNPMTVFITSAAAVTAGTTQAATIQAPKFMLGVYDPESMLNGFIDPTSATFAVYDKNRPASAYLSEATGNVAEATAVAALGGQGAALLTANNAAALAGVDANGATALAAQTVAAGSARSGSITLSATAETITVNSTAVTANSLVLLSVVDAAPVAGTFAILTAAPAAGSFVFKTNTAAKKVQFVVVN
jgi:hypothetical protein